MRRIASLLLLLILGLPAFAGTSAVTATITDSDSQTWNNGTFQVTFVPQAGVPASSYNVNGATFTQFVTGSMNGSGVITVTLTDLSTITPIGAQWRFTMCPNASASCPSVVTNAVVGATPNLSSVLSSGLAGPRFSAGQFSFGYLDVEVFPNPAPGSTYFNVTTNATRMWNGSVWTGASGGGSGFSGTVTYTSNQSASTSDNGKLVRMNCSSACAYTLPNPQPSTTFYAEVESTGSTLATIALGSSITVNGSSTAPLLTTNGVYPFWSDTQTATNYLQVAPSGVTPGVFTSTQYNTSYNFSNTGGTTCTNNASLKNTAVVYVCLNGPATGDQSGLNSGVESWVTVNDPNSDSTNANPNVNGYAFHGNTTCAVQNTVCEGIFTTAQDTAGKTGVTLVGFESDTSVNNTGTVAYGLQLIPVGSAQPTGDNYPAVYAYNFNGASHFTSGMDCPVGSISVQSNSAPCVRIAYQGGVGSANERSQTLQFIATNGTGVSVPLDLFTNFSSSSGTATLTSLQSYSQIVTTVFSRNTAQTSGNIAISGWGTGSAVSAVSGYAQRMAFTITAGTTPSANPTVTVTFSDAMPFAPICVAFPEGGTGTQANLFRATESATTSGAMVWQGGTPSNGLTYLFVIDCRL